MPKILKILGKSFLCFIGLAAAGWAVDALCNLLMSIHGQIFFTLLYATILGYILWFLLAAAYAYTLFLVFRNEKRRFLIMALNGAAVYLILYILLYLIIYSQYYIYINTDILWDAVYISAEISRAAGLTTIILAFMFKSLSQGKTPYEANKVLNKALNIFWILGKLILCFIALLAVSKGYYLLLINANFKFGIYASLFDTDIFLPLIASVYAYTLYRLLKKHARRQLIIMINAAFLLLVWGLILIPSIFIVIDRSLLAKVCGNTAIMTLVLMFIFRSVEKRGKTGNSNYKDSSAANAP